MASFSRTSYFEWHFPLQKSGIIFFMNAVILLWSVTLAKTLQPILWDKNNSNFTSSPNGLNITAEINDLIDFKCPVFENTTEGRLKAQYHTIMQVSSMGYQSCSLNVGRKRKMLSCNRPFDENIKLTLLFQEWTPYPGGATFAHGEEYYFITTSDGTANGIDNNNGGLCQSNSMKLRVYIKPRPTGNRPRPPPQRPALPTTVNPNATTTTSSPTTTRRSTRRSTTTRKPTTTMTTTVAPTTIKATTTLATTAKATTKESNKISNPRGSNASCRCSVSSSLLLVAWLVTVVRWLDL